VYGSALKIAFMVDWFREREKRKTRLTMSPRPSSKINCNPTNGALEPQQRHSRPLFLPISTFFTM
jgi:hypothetical protein